MTRVTEPARNLGLAIALALAALLLTACTAETGSGPRLLMICADTVRADVFYRGDIQDKFSPWLQRGQRYSDVTTPAPWTLPTIASVFTGLYPAQHGAGRLAAPVANLAEQTPTALHTEAVTLAEVLDGEGFSTAMFSAHPWLKSGFGLDQGFRHTVFQPDDQGLIDRMLDWLGGIGKGGPSFTYLHLMGSHDLHRASRDDLVKILAGVDAPTTQFLQNHTTARACARPDSARCLRNQVYLLSILRTRETLAGLMVQLENRGLLQDTQVVLFSDHGEAFQEHLAEQGRLGPDPRGSHGGGHGQYLYQELLHVPLVAWLPGAGGREFTQPASLVDLFPTVLDWLNVDYPGPQVQGQALADEPSGPSNSRAIYASNIAYGPQSVAVREGQYKAIYWPEHDLFHIFNLRTDAAERNPLQRDDLLLGFSTLAGDYLEAKPQFDAAAPELDAEHLKDLQSIGYLQGEEEDNP